MRQQQQQQIMQGGSGQVKAAVTNPAFPPKFDKGEKVGEGTYGTGR